MVENHTKERVLKTIRNRCAEIASIKIWNLANETANGEWLEYKQVLKKHLTFKKTPKPTKQKLVSK